MKPIMTLGLQGDNLTPKEEIARGRARGEKCQEEVEDSVLVNTNTQETRLAQKTIVREYLTIDHLTLKLSKVRNSINATSVAGRGQLEQIQQQHYKPTSKVTISLTRGEETVVQLLSRPRLRTSQIQRRCKVLISNKRCLISSIENRTLTLIQNKQTIHKE